MEVMTLRSLMSARFDVQMLSGDRTSALETIDRIHDLQEKPADRAMSGVFERSVLQAWTETGTASGPAFANAYEKDLATRVNALPWGVVQDQVKGIKAWTDMATPKLLVNQTKTFIDPKALKRS